jgi:hypothetical protein
VLGFAGVDAGGGWLILALPPAEIAVHPSEQTFVQRHAGHELLGAVVYLMCDDIHATIRWIEARGGTASAVETANWGIRTTLRLPSGGELGLYQPNHRTALAPRPGGDPRDAAG